MCVSCWPNVFNIFECLWKCGADSITRRLAWCAQAIFTSSGFSPVCSPGPASLPRAKCELLLEHTLLIVLSSAKLNGVFLMRKRVWIPIHMLQLMSNPTSNRCWPLYYKGRRANYSWANFQFWSPIRNLLHFQGCRSL